jgi:hypothetical protein
MKTCYVITGIIDKYDINLLIEFYSNIQDKIISTWNNQDTTLIDELKNNGFIIIQDDYPINNKQTNYQSKAVNNGCLKAKELGYSHVIRMRTDIHCDKTYLFLNLLINEYFNKDKLVCFSGIETNDGVYFYDVMIGGEVNKVLDFFKNDQSMDDNRYIEKYLLEMYLDKTDITREDVKSIFNFCYLNCRMLDIKFYFFKKNMEIINDYCNRDFIWI